MAAIAPIGSKLYLGVSAHDTITYDKKKIVLYQLNSYTDPTYTVITNFRWKRYSEYEKIISLLEPITDDTAQQQFKAIIPKQYLSFLKKKEDEKFINERQGKLDKLVKLVAEYYNGNITTLQFKFTVDKWLNIDNNIAPDQHVKNVETNKPSKAKQLLNKGLDVGIKLVGDKLGFEAQSESNVNNDPEFLEYERKHKEQQQQVVIAHKQQVDASPVQQRIHIAINQKDEDKLTFAFKQGWQDVAIALINDLTKDQISSDTIFQVIEYGFVDVFKAIISKGIDPNLIITSHTGVLVGGRYIDVTTYDGQIKSVKVGQKERINKITFIYKAAESSAPGAAEIIKYLVSLGVNVNNKWGWDRTPLVWACWQGNWINAKTLIELGANCNTKDEYGISAVEHALGGGKDNKDKPSSNEHIAIMLVENGAALTDKELKLAVGQTYHNIMNAQKVWQAKNITNNNVDEKSSASAEEVLTEAERIALEAEIAAVRAAYAKPPSTCDSHVWDSDKEYARICHSCAFDNSKCIRCKSHVFSSDANNLAKACHSCAFSMHKCSKCGGTLFSSDNDVGKLCSSCNFSNNKCSVIKY